MSDKNIFELKTGDICEIFREYDPDETQYCKILNVSNYWVLCELIADDGENMGITLFKLESIQKVRFDSKMLKLLFKEKSTSFQVVPTSENILPKFIMEIDAFFGCSSFYCEDIDKEDFWVGNVERYNKEVVFIKEYRPLWKNEKTTIGIPLEDITRIDAGGEFEKRRLNFYEKNTIKQ